MIAEKVGRYRILRQLGSGGMGEVYLAEDPSLQRQVALKILSGTDEKSKRRFVREAITASKLSHPNVAVIHEAGESDGIAFIAMQYVEGETLRDRLDRGPLPIADIVRIGREVADALDDAHRHGIVHRDIKPANIIIDDRGHAKVLDFGIAKLIDSLAMPDESTAVAETTAGKFLGTLHYVSPEQAGGGVIDARTDIFSLGIVLYEMVTGSNPFAANSFLETVRRVRELTPPPIDRADCPADLKRIITKCLEKDPQRRYGSARDLIVDLERSAGSPAGVSRLRAGSTWITALAILAVAVFLLWRHPSATAPPSAKIESIAVLPFVNFSPDRQNEFIGDGITEEVINGLAQLNGLKVVSRTSAFAFKGTRSDIREVGKSLGVDAVVEGSVQRASDRLRVTAQLINAHDGYHLWSETYNGAVGDVFSIEDQISRSVAKALQRTMGRTPASPSTRDIAAYDLYLKARREELFLTRVQVNDAIRDFKAAIDRDPSFAEAYAGLAETYSLLDHRPGLTTLEPKETYALAVEAANKALNLDPDSVEAHTAVGHIDMHLGRFDEAQAHLNRALQLNPNYSTAYLWHGILMRTLGQYEAGKKELARAEQLDPLSASLLVYTSVNAWIAGDYEGARSAAERGIQLDPQNAPLHQYLAEADMTLGRFSDAEEELRRSEKLGNRSTLDESRALLLALSGRREEAVALLRQIGRNARGAAMPRMMRGWAAVGDVDEAARWLDRIVREIPDYGRLAIELPPHPAFAKMRSDPRYLEARRKLGLPPPENLSADVAPALSRRRAD